MNRLFAVIFFSIISITLHANECLKVGYQTYCAPFGGTILKIGYGVKCGIGQCTQMNSYTIRCSKVQGGKAEWATHYAGFFKCAGGCEEPKKRYCIKYK
jgi:hypothetical protein